MLMLILKHSESGPPWHVPARLLGERHNPVGLVLVALLLGTALAVLVLELLGS
jgi:hypothetical protein